jgi:hypothetical protein
MTDHNDNAGKVGGRNIRIKGEETLLDEQEYSSNVTEEVIYEQEEGLVDDKPDEPVITKMAYEPIINPYTTDGVRDKILFETTHVLAKDEDTINRINDIFEQFMSDMNKIKALNPKRYAEDIEYQKIAQLMQEYVVLSENSFPEGSNYHEWFKENGHTKQRLTTNTGSQLGVNYLTQSAKNTPENMEGVTATNHALQTSGLSIGAGVCCFASGVRLIISPFTTTELSTFCTMLSMSDDAIGKSTAGASYTGDDVVINMTIIEMFLDKVTGTNVDEINKRMFDKNRLKELILLTDMLQIKAGLLAAIYPRGYPVWHPCSNSDCDYNLVSAKGPDGTYLPDSLLDFSLITHTRMELLTAEDVEHWSKKTVTIDEVKAYQKRREDVFNVEFNSEQVFLKNSSYGVDTTHTVKFKIPNLSEYVTEANKWVAGIETHIAITIDQNRPANMPERSYSNFRKARALKYATDISLGKYTPYIQYIEIKDAQNPTTGRKIINSKQAILTQLNEAYSANPDSLQTLTTLAKTLKEKYTMTFAGVPNFPCPCCGYGQTSNEDDANKLIAVNLNSFFTTLMFWRYQS